MAGRHAALGAYHTLVDLMICCRLFSLIGAVWAAGVDMKRVVGDANLYFIMFSCPANSRGVDGKVSSAALAGVEVRDLDVLWVALIGILCQRTMRDLVHAVRTRGS